MPGKVPQRSSSAPKRGASASLGKKITSKARIKPSPKTNSTSTNSDAQDTGAAKQEQDLNKYNKALEKYHNEDKDLAFMKEENFSTETDSDKKISISELNEYMASSDSLASRIASANGRRNSNFGSGRSRLPGDESGGVRTGDNVPDFLPRFALTRSQLYLGYDPNTGEAAKRKSNGSFTSRISNSSNSAVSNRVSGNSSNSSSANFEAYSSAYLKANAPELSRQFESDPSFRQKYLNNVKKLYNGLDIRTLGNAPVESKRSRLVGRASEASSRDKQQVANSFMTLLAKNDKQVDKIANSGLTVFVADSIVSAGENVAGYFSTDNHMVLSRNPGFASFNATAVHELTHVLDFSDGSLDGHINGLANNWSNLRESASQKINSGASLPGLDSGFTNYSQTNDLEFLAVMSQLYQSDTQDLQRNFPQIFSALDRMFRVA